MSKPGSFSRASSAISISPVKPTARARFAFVILNWLLPLISSTFELATSTRALVIS
jgi:hypothetical protein